MVAPSKRSQQHTAKTSHLPVSVLVLIIILEKKDILDGLKLPEDERDKFC